MFTQRQLLLAKVESSYGVDAAPAAAANAVLAKMDNVQIAGKTLARDNIMGYFGAGAIVNALDSLKIDFTTEVRGSGNPGTVPDTGVLFRGCNFAETITASVKVDYDPHSSAGIPYNILLLAQNSA
ncbi:MAG: hypothetical protein HZB80_11300 [Deltaproteobacteria bacterium]|nr:hypothetical protein [Deltaproteobacteria bacterium]